VGHRKVWSFALRQHVFSSSHVALFQHVLSLLLNCDVAVFHQAHCDQHQVSGEYIVLKQFCVILLALLLTAPRYGKTSYVTILKLTPLRQRLMQPAYVSSLLSKGRYCYLFHDFTTTTTYGTE